MCTYCKMMRFLSYKLYLLRKIQISKICKFHKKPLHDNDNENIIVEIKFSAQIKVNMCIFLVSLKCFNVQSTLNIIKCKSLEFLTISMFTHVFILNISKYLYALWFNIIKKAILNFMIAQCGRRYNEEKINYLFNFVFQLIKRTSTISEFKIK